MAEQFYITTPIYYVNAKPHLGHAYTTIVADVVNRFHAMQGHETFFLTGTDEHGDKIERAARNAGASTREYVDQIAELFKQLWPELNIRYNRFIRTTDPAHMTVVGRILQNIYDKGDIYFSEYEGLYCYGCERFYMERELVDGKCPDHQTAPEILRESNYFFKMSKYQDWLIRHIEENPDFIRPERYKNEVLSFLKDPLEDLCISRPKSRLQWGITLPFDENFVTYVWFDALLNYVSALGYPDGELFKKFWPAAQHIVAKDILKPHGIYWPIMLKAADIPPYRHLNVHGYWNVDEGKMSKSLGNVVEPLDMKNIYGLDAFRYFLIREMAFGLDSGFNEPALVQRINADLANDLGNLFSRVTAMTHKYLKGVVPKPSAQAEDELAQLKWGSLAENALQTVETYTRDMSVFAFHRALATVWEFINQMNKFIDVAAPWELAKNKKSADALEAVLYHLLEGLRVVSGLIYPVMPETAEKMQEHLGLNPKDPFYMLTALKTWNVLKPGGQLPRSTRLFPRVETKPVQPEAEAPKPQPKTPPIKPEIDLDVFSQVDLRVARVLHAEPVPGARKLLKLEVELDGKRTIVAGIANHYAPADLIGKQIIVVANLKPARLMGVESRGMLLAASDGAKTVLAVLDQEVAPGTCLR